MKQAKKRQAKYADKGTKQVEFQINDPVYYKNNQRKGKLDCKWKPFYRIIERKGPATYVIKNPLNGSTCKVHAEMLRDANLDEWDIPTIHDGRPMRKTAYAIPPEQSSDEHDSDSEQEGPYEKLVKKYQKEREDSDDEDNISLMELSKRLKVDKTMEQQQNEDSRADESEGVIEETMDFEPATDSDSLTETYFDENADDAMSVNEIKILDIFDKASPELSNELKKKKKKLTNTNSSNKKVKQLLQAITNMF